MSNDRIPQENHSETTGLNRFLKEASDEARRILGSIQALAGTTYCKGVHIPRHEELEYQVEQT